MINANPFRENRQQGRRTLWFIAAGIFLMSIVPPTGAWGQQKYDDIDDDVWLDFTWTAPGNAPGVLAYYNVYVAMDGGAFSYHDTTSANAYCVLADSGHSYRIRVAGVNAWGQEGTLSDGSDEILCAAASPDVTPPQSPEGLAAQESAGAVLLTWPAVTQDSLGSPENISHYVIYRGEDAFFTPQSSDSVAGIQSNSYLDETSAIGSSEHQTFYVITAVDAAGNESPLSNRVGEFDQAIPPQVAGYLLISLTLDDSQIVNAKDLGQNIPNCTAVKEWDSQTQSYASRAFKIGDTWYGQTELHMGYPYYVFLEAGPESTWTIVGSVPDDAIFSLYAPGGNGYNTITLPLSSDIATASELGQSIPYCTAVKRWHPRNQAYESIAFKVGDTWFGSTAVEPGQPYFVNVTQDGVWPGSKAVCNDRAATTICTNE